MSLFSAYNTHVVYRLFLTRKSLFGACLTLRMTSCTQPSLLVDSLYQRSTYPYVKRQSNLLTLEALPVAQSFFVTVECVCLDDSCSSCRCIHVSLLLPLLTVLTIPMMSSSCNFKQIYFSSLRLMLITCTVSKCSYVIVTYMQMTFFVLTLLWLFPRRR